MFPRPQSATQLATDTYPGAVLPANEEQLLNGTSVDPNTGARLFIPNDLFLGGMIATIASANNLTLTASAVFIVTGSTQINTISTVGRTAGNGIKLIFTGSPTVKHGISGLSNTAPILLSGGIDFSASNAVVLTFVYDGTHWQESARSINHV